MSVENVAATIADLEARHRALLAELARVETALGVLEAMRSPRLPLESPPAPDRADVGSAKWLRQRPAAPAPPPPVPCPPPAPPRKRGPKPRLELDRQGLEARVREILARRSPATPIELQRALGVSRHASQKLIRWLLVDRVLVSAGARRGLVLSLAPDTGTRRTSGRPPAPLTRVSRPTVRGGNGEEYETTWNGELGRQGKSLSSVDREE